MSGWSRFVERPQTSRARWWIFQIHLWAGIIAALYLVVVGVSGSLLVFREELTALVNGSLMRAADPTAPVVDVETVMARARAAYPAYRIDGVQMPSLYTTNVRVAMSGPRSLVVYADRASGAVVGAWDRGGSWITWLQQLHFDLLLGRTGRLWNGIGGIVLVLLCATGLVVWWPGVRRWKRSLMVDFRARWKRINWDLHSAGGLWTVLFVLMWGVTGAYFTWPREYAVAIHSLSPITNAQPPRVRVKPSPGERLGVNRLVEEARRLDPACRFAAVQLPAAATAPVVVLMAREELWNTRGTNYLYFDPYRGTLLGRWRRGVAQTAGDRIYGLLGPLHFGVYWGMTVKVLWAVVGLALPLLAITGLLMYWNRVLARKLRQGGLRRG